MTDTMWHPPVTHESVDITPDLAAKWVEAYNIHNRDPRDWRVRMLARDMDAGRFPENGENGVTFDWDNNIAGGQHTLLAIIRSGRTVRLRVTRNVDPASRDTMNDALKERLADRLKVAGVRNTTTAESMLRRVVYYNAHRGLTGQTNAKFSKADLMNEWPKYAQPIVDTIATCNPYDNGSIWPGNRGAMHFSYYLLRWYAKSSPDAVKEFFELICYGSQEADEKVLFNRLRVKFREYKDANTQVFWILKAWNAWAKGEKLTVLQAPRDSIDAGTHRMVLANKHYPKIYRAR